jgi:hypothetical protein
MARVIEKKIIDTISTWKDGDYRLSCRDRVNIDRGIAIYYLWDSPIFKLYKLENGKYNVNFSFCNWGSQTTKERISELLWHFADCYITRKNWVHYLKNKHTGKYYSIDVSKTYAITDNKLFFSVTGEEVKEVEDFKY